MNKINKANPFLLTAASIALTLGIAACNKNQPPDNSAQNQAAQPDQTQPADQSQQDPAAAANLAPASATQPAPPAPAASPTSNNQPYQSNSNDSDNNYNNNNEDDDSNYGQPVLQASAPPPELPEYSQPDCPGDGYLWTPGYWSFGPQGYFWVPGAWTQPPEIGYLWTPGYWGYVGGQYAITTVIGAVTSAITAASTMDSATLASVTRGDIGTETVSTTTAR